MFIYARRPVSKDLQYMGVYDGASGRSGKGGTIISNILELADGREFRYTPEEFVTFYEQL